MSRKACTSREHQIVDALFGDLEEAGLRDLHGHMDTCPGCQHAFQEMQQTLSFTSQLPEPELPDTYWDSYYDKLQERMAPGAARPGFLDRLRPGAWIEKLRLPDTVWQPALQWSAALALVLFGVFIGRQWDTQATPGTSNPAIMADPALTTVQLSEKTHEYLDQSKVLLLGLVNFDLEEDDPSFLNLAHQQVVAGELVQRAALLKEELNENREQQLSRLIEELELILLQIANLEIQEDVPSIELIQRGVDRGDLLMKINLEKMKLSDQELSARPADNTSQDALVF